MPWRARTDVGFSFVALVLVAAVVVSCVTVTTSAGVPGTAAPPPAHETSVPDAKPAPRSLGERRTVSGTDPSERDPTAPPEPEPRERSTSVPRHDATREPVNAAFEPHASMPARELAGAAPAPGSGPATEPSPTAVPPSSTLTQTAPAEAPPPDTTPTQTVPAEAPLPDTTPTQEPSAARTESPSPLPPGSAAPGAALPSTAPEALLPASSAPPHGSRADAVLDRRTVRRIERVLARTTGKKRVAGLQVAVRLADGRTWLGAAGSSEFAPPRPVEDDTVFAIASVTKTFIAALILQLAEQDKLDLDAPYGRYVNDGPRRKHATIRQLLSHTSGIYNYFENPRYLRISTAWLRTRPQAGLLAREHEWTYDEIMDLVKPISYCKPGACYHYSNTNFVLLGRVAEAVGGAPLDRLLRRRFFRPLGLEDTYFQPADVPPADAAHGSWDHGTGHSDHTRDDRQRPFMAAVSVADAAGAIASTARDLSVWADALYGGKVLSRASVAQLTAFQPDGSYGLGTDYAVFAGHPAYGHRGGLRGFESSMWYFPEQSVTIVLLSNQGNWLTDVPMNAIVAAVLGTRGR